MHREPSAPGCTSKHTCPVLAVLIYPWGLENDCINSKQVTSSDIPYASGRASNSSSISVRWHFLSPLSSVNEGPLIQIVPLEDCWEGNITIAKATWRLFELKSVFKILKNCQRRDSSDSDSAFYRNSED